MSPLKTRFNDLMSNLRYLTLIGPCSCSVIILLISVDSHYTDAKCFPLLTFMSLRLNFSLHPEDEFLTFLCCSIEYLLNFPLRVGFCWFYISRSITPQFILEEQPLSHSQSMQLQGAGSHVLQSWICDSGQYMVNKSEMGIWTKLKSWNPCQNYFGEENFLLLWRWLISKKK